MRSKGLMVRFTFSVFLVLVVLGGMSLPMSCGKSSAPQANAELLVAMAADFQPAGVEIARALLEKDGIKVTISAGSSGLLQRQAREGAPFDVFMSADMARVESLAAEGVIDPTTVMNYAYGVLVLWQPEGKGPRLRDTADLGRPEFATMRLAIAHPDHAPYGVAAKTTLERLGLWNQLGPNLVYGENAFMTFQYAQTGNVGAAFVPLSLVKPDWPGIIFVEESLYDPIRQGLGIVTRTRERAAAERFVEYLQGPEGAAIMRRYGFKIPVAADDVQP